jgi:hypothetical protein
MQSAENAFSYGLRLGSELRLPAYLFSILDFESRIVKPRSCALRHSITNRTGKAL